MTDTEQRSEAWFQSRLGRATASRIADVISRTKSGWGAGRANYAAELIAERLTGVTAERFQNAAMQWGTDTEPHARDAYEFYSDNDVELIGLVEHPSIPMTSASPDGLVGNDGLVEFKCPNTSTHIDTLLGKPIDKKYLTQMHWQMACTERQWCDFVSFDPRMPEEMRIRAIRVARDDGRIKELETAVVEFLAELDAKEAELRKHYRMPEAA